MATDYGFNSDSHAHTNGGHQGRRGCFRSCDSHAHTNGDMTDGESALASSNDATHQLNGAQTDTRWTSAQGPSSFRGSTIAFFGSVDEMLADEQDVFDTFRTNLSIAEQEARGTEEANAAILEAINRALQSDPETAAAAAAASSAASGASGANSAAGAATPSTPPADAPTPVGEMPEF